MTGITTCHYLCKEVIFIGASHKDINSILHRMRNEGRIKGATAKGDPGEEAALAVCLNKQERIGGIIYHSFSYPYGTHRDGRMILGNVFYQNGTYATVAKEADDEIDILYVTKFRVLVIEVKAYHAESKSATGKGKRNGITIDDTWMYRDSIAVDKSPIEQAEKHARHLYRALWEVLPDGKPQYIVPMVVFVDKCDIHDKRCDERKNYIPVCVLNTLAMTIDTYNTPLKYNIDIEEVKKALGRVCKDCKQEFV